MVGPGLTGGDQGEDEERKPMHVAAFCGGGGLDLTGSCADKPASRQVTCAGLRAIPLGVAHFAINASTSGRAVVGWSRVAKPKVMNAPDWGTWMTRIDKGRNDVRGSENRRQAI